MSLTDARAARHALEGLLDVNALRLPEGFADAVERYVALLLDANRRVNLTRVVEPDAVARLHLLDSLAALPLIQEIGPTRALDLGSGGGVPGIVLALATPDTSWTLVDSVGKKADAMRAFVRELGMPNVAVVSERAEVLGHDPDHRERYEVVTARACAALPVLVEYALPLLSVGGSLLAWKGPLSEEERSSGTRAATELGGDTPALAETGFDVLGEHRFVVVAKAAPTPARYPRRPGQPSRSPLGR